MMAETTNTTTNCNKCKNYQPIESVKVSYGWICPRCGRGVAPDERVCPECSPWFPTVTPNWWYTTTTTPITSNVDMKISL